MDGQQFVEAVREAERTELERLGSDKALLAATGADLESDVVLGVVIGQERALATVLDEWAEEEDDERAGETFAAAADAVREHVDRLEAAREESSTAADEEQVHLGDPDGTVERAAAGLVGQSLVLDRTLLQGVSFFVNEADERRADLLRDVRSGVSDRLDSGAALLEERCGGDDDWERAQAATRAVVDAAYGEYEAALSEMGLDPKPVC